MKQLLIKESKSIANLSGDSLDLLADKADTLQAKSYSVIKSKLDLSIINSTMPELIVKSSQQMIKNKLFVVDSEVKQNKESVLITLHILSMNDRDVAISKGDNLATVKMVEIARFRQAAGVSSLSKKKPGRRKKKTNE